MMLEIVPGSAVPPFEQIRSQLAGLIRTGALPVGHRLPSIRQLANDLGLAAGTVARAYHQLESAGLVVSRVRHGTSVAAVPPTPEPGIDASLRTAAAAYAAAALRVGADRRQVLTALEEQLGLGGGLTAEV